MSNAVHVAVGVVLNGRGQVLIALRQEGQHQGGLWEFPGGKVEAGETCQHALVRELNEELGVRVLSSEPLIKVSHAYSDKSVILDVWTISNFTHTPFGKEGQVVRWVDILALSQYRFPRANIPIVKALLLPSLVAITGHYKEDVQDFLYRAKRSIERGAGLIQLRLSRSIAWDDCLFAKLKILCVDHHVKLVVNSALNFCDYDDSVGLHLTSRNLMSLVERPVEEGVLLGASCHNKEELQQAEQIGVDYVFLSPVKKTNSHEGAVVLGWHGFSELVQSASIPVYALGGLDKGDIEVARACGAQGVAAIGAVWGE